MLAATTGLSVQQAREMLAILRQMPAQQGAGSTELNTEGPMQVDIHSGAASDITGMVEAQANEEAEALASTVASYEIPASGRDSPRIDEGEI
jgi:hypothetical protein